MDHLAVLHVSEGENDIKMWGGRQRGKCVCVLCVAV